MLGILDSEMAGFSNYLDVETESAGYFNRSSCRSQQCRRASSATSGRRVAFLPAIARIQRAAIEKVCVTGGAARRIATSALLPS